GETEEIAQDQETVGERAEHSVAVGVEHWARGSEGEETREAAAALAILTDARPRHHEAAVIVPRDCGVALEVGGVGVDLELRAGRADAAGAAGGEAAREHAVLGSVLAVALPGHDERSVRAH